VKRVLSLAAFAFACAVAACAPTRLVAPLRYEGAITLDQPFRAQPPPIAPVTEASDSVRETRLANGVRVVLVERHGFPVVAAHLILDRGSVDLDDAGGIGVREMQYFFARGGDERASERISADAARLGLGSNTGATADDAWVAVRSPTASFDAALDLLAGLVHAELSAEEYDRRAAEWAGQGGYRLAPVEILERRVLFDLKSAYGYAGPGSSPITREQAVSLHDRIFQPTHATLVIVGDVTPAQVDASALRSFGGWTAKETVRKNTSPSPLRTAYRLVVLGQSGLVQRHGAVFARGPVAASPDMEAFELLAKVLGGAVSSKLFGHLRRESGAAFDVGARVEVSRDATWVSLFGSYDADKAVAGVKDVLTSIDGVRSGRVPEDEFSAARETLVAEWRSAMASVDGAAGMYARAAALGVGVDRVRDFPARVMRLGGQDLARVARDYLAPEALHVALVGDVRGLDTDPLGMGKRTTFQVAR
jgi:zinc protease